VAELASQSATLGQALHPGTAASLAGLVRVMNTYYSNLIEGHNTRPRDIERALAGDLDENEERRNLQLEAAAHGRVLPRTRPYRWTPTSFAVRATSFSRRTGRSAPCCRRSTLTSAPRFFGWKVRARRWAPCREDRN
jgi:hypothetical protein